MLSHQDPIRQFCDKSQILGTRIGFLPHTTRLSQYMTSILDASMNCLSKWLDYAGYQTNRTRLLVLISLVEIAYCRIRMNVNLNYVPRSLPERDVMYAPFPFFDTVKSAPEEWLQMSASINPLHSKGRCASGQIHCNVRYPFSNVN